VFSVVNAGTKDNITSSKTTIIVFNYLVITRPVDNTILGLEEGKDKSEKILRESRTRDLLSPSPSLTQLMSWEWGMW